MSYESRQKKRRHKRIEKGSRRAPETAKRWFLTLAKKPGKYMCCGDGFERGADLVYRHEPRAVRCVRCADKDPDCRYRPSIRWERSRRVPSVRRP